jgi:hypothetical protein
MAEKENKLLQFGQDALDLYGNYYIGKEGAQTATDLGQRAFDESSLLATDVAGMAEFKPFTVTTGLGTADVGAQGGYALNLSPEQQAMQDTALSQAQTFMSGVGQDPMQRELLAQARQGFAGIGQDPRQRALLSQADTAFGRAMADPRLAQADLYEQMRAVQRPEEQRQSLALEERMLSQGRMGFSSSAYGGSSPELLALQTAREEAKNRASLSARQQAMQEQQQAYGQGLGLLGQASGMRQRDLAEALGLQGAGYMPQQQQLAAATGLMGLGYMPQQQALGALGYGLEGAKLSDIGRRTGAELYGQAGATGIEALMKGLQEASAYDLGMTSQAVGGVTSGMLSDGEGGTGWGVDLVTNLINYLNKDDDED